MHDTPNSSKFRFNVRDGGGGGGSGLSTGTIIVIAVVCGCVFLLALTLFLWRFLVRCCGSRASVPLPPVQELAHHRREQQRAAFTEAANAKSRPGTWVDSPIRSPYTGSAVSLLTQPEKNLSLYTDEMTAESTMPSQEDGGKLYPPNPSFYRASDASSSRNTLAESASGSQSSLPSATSLSPSPISESTGRPRSGQMSRPPSSHSRPRVPSASRGQRLSQISDSPTSGSGFTGRSVATSHHGGPPHRPGSSVQIVLPAPLASQAVYAREGQPMYNNPLLARSSVYADQWLTANGSDGCSTSDEAMVMPLTKSRSRSRHRPAASVPNVSQDPVPSSPRTASQHSPASRSRSRLRKQRHEDGAQADVPARYSNLADLAESVYESDGARGRSRRQTQLEIIPSGRISHSSSSNPLDR